jgi:hypothetical protein
MIQVLTLALWLLLGPLAPSSIAATSAEPSPPPDTVRPLPGGFDSVPMFNSNSPEVVQEPGILLSTLPPDGRTNTAVHLNYRFKGRFNVFLHHIAKAKTPEDLRTLYVAVLLYNNGKKPVTVRIEEAASYLSQPDAPFIPMEPICEGTDKTIYAGPGDRVMTELLKGVKQPGWPAALTVPPDGYAVLMNLPIPVKGLVPPLNGRSALLKLNSDAPVYASSIATFPSSDSPPTLDEWLKVLHSGIQASPREKPATTGEPGLPLIYGRVSGVQNGSTWSADLTDSAKHSTLSLPAPGSTVSFPISTVIRGTFGTKQIQSAPLAVRTPDTAVAAHGNYAVRYDLRIPLKNDTSRRQAVSLLLQSPLKSDQQAPLQFQTPPATQVHFRGTIKVSYRDDKGVSVARFIHLVLTKGDPGQSLVNLQLKPHELRQLRVEFYYPPDATPPQVLTVRNSGPV